MSMILVFLDTKRLNVSMQQAATRLEYLAASARARCIARHLTATSWLGRCCRCFVQAAAHVGKLTHRLGEHATHHRCHFFDGFGSRFGCLRRVIEIGFSWLKGLKETPLIQQKLPANVSHKGTTDRLILGQENQTPDAVSGDHCHVWPRIQETPPSPERRPHGGLDREHPPCSTRHERTRFLGCGCSQPAARRIHCVGR